MITLNVTINNKIATYLKRDGHIVCGNNDYTIAFSFDSEWEGAGAKTARFIWNGKYYDVDILANNTCSAPIITNATEVTVGVYAGNLKTTTPATIPCEKSILCGTQTTQDNTPVAPAQSATQAAQSATQAAQSATSADTSASRAQASATAAANSATQAQTSATAAQNAQTAIASMLNEYITEIDTLIGG